MARVIEIPDFNNVIIRYKSGESLFKLSKELGVSRGGINRKTNGCFGLTGKLIKAGVNIRSYTESQRTRYANTSDDRKKQIPKMAQEARRGQTDSIEVKMKRCASRAKMTIYTGKWEAEFVEEFRKYGIDVIHQYPLTGYNIDIAIPQWKIAVEIESGPAFYRRRPFLFKRTKNILDQGWDIAFIAINNITVDIATCTKNLITNFQLFGRNHSGTGAYGVIRGDGKPGTAPAYNLDGFTRVF